MNHSVGEMLAERYELRACMGHDHTATVWCAKDHLLERDVAVKFLPDAYEHNPVKVEEFKHQVSSVARCTHSRIVHVYDYGNSQERPFMVMEWLPGSSMQRRIENGEELPLPLYKITRQMLEAVKQVHDAGFVYRQLWQSDFMFDAAGDLRLVDFGIARMSADEIGRVDGKEFLAPELVNNKEVEPNVISDLYSVGAIMKSLGACEIEVVKKLTNANPAKRYQNADEALSDLNSRYPVTEEIAAITEEDLAKAANNNGKAGRIWAAFAGVSFFLVSASYAFSNSLI